VDINIGTLLGQTIAMIVFVWFCMKYIWPVIMSAIEARQVALAEGLAAAESGQSALVTAQAEADKLVVAARDQARGIMDQANTRATAIVEQGKAEGEAERKRQLEAARAEIDVEMNRAREELRGQVAALAIAAAEKVLSRESDAGTHRELLARAANDL
jgi:F-type H+-transporting ATPase subunit b